MKSVRCLGLILAFVAVDARANDWPIWRGPEQTGMTREKAVVTSWSLQGENLLWKSEIGGRTTPILMNGRMYTIAPHGEGTRLKEAVFCIDADTGRNVWTTTFDMFFTDMAESRVGWTALAGDPETGNVYAHTTSGEFYCLDRDGKVAWKRSLIEEFSRVSGYGGRLHTPVIDEDRVVVSFLNVNWGNHNRPTHRYVAFDKRTGAVAWWAEPGGRPEDTTYSCPVIAVINGRRMLIAPAADGNVYGMLSRTGERVWSFNLSKRGLNVSPVVAGDHVFVAHSEENLDTTEMGRVVCIDASKTGDITKAGEVWRRDGLDVGYASPAIANGRLYVVTNTANLLCLDAVNGRTIWEHSLGRVGKGSPVVTADGVIYVGEQNGIFHILKDSGDKCETLHRHEFTRPDRAIDEFFGSPAVLNGRVYFMTRYGTYCLGRKDTPVQTAAIPPLPPEKKSGGPPKVITVHPADALLAPGRSMRFEIRAFNEDRQPISPPPAANEWSITDLKGTMSADGTFTAAADGVFMGGMVTARLGELKASARVRVAPRGAVRVDFEEMKVGDIPPGWVGVAGKTRVVEKDSGKALEKYGEKNRPSPSWRARGFSGPPIPIGCTVEADIMGTISTRRFKPDMGLLNGRYEMILLGQARELELSRWRDEPTCGLRHRVPFEMQPDQWYRFKFNVTLEGGRALLKGKVWPRGEEEPAAWTIETADDAPNSEGAPGIYVFSNGTTEKSDGPSVFFDNYQVTPQ